MPKVAPRVAGLATAGLLGVGALLIPGTGSGAAGATATGSAYGVRAVGGIINIAPTPTAPPNGPSVASINQPGLTTGVLTASASPNATGFTSAASVANVNALSGQIRADLVASTCTASGTKLTGNSTFTNLAITPTVVTGLPPVPAPPILVPMNPAPNTTLTIPGVAKVVLNEQITSPDGQTLTVNAVHITSTAFTQQIVIADSVCTLGDATATTTSSTTPATTTTSSTTPATTATATATTKPPTRPTTTGASGATRGAPGATTTPTTKPPTTPTTTGASGATRTAPGATPVQARPAFTG